MNPDYLVHFNPNHDPKTGQFAYSHSKNGSRQTEKLANKLASTSTMYGQPNRKLLNKFIESSRKDEDEAYANKDYDMAKSIAAGRTYMRMLVDGDLRQQVYDNLAYNTDIVSPGEKFVANFTRDDKSGGVILRNTSNGKSTGMSDSKYDYSDVEYYK